MNKYIKPNPKNHFNLFLKLLDSNTPFSYIRFSDGEVEVLRNRDLVISNRKIIFRGKEYKNKYPQLDSKKFSPLFDKDFRKDLLESSLYKNKYFYKGIRTFSISDPEALIDREFLLRLNGGFDEYITFTDLLINENYLLFRSKMLPFIFNSNKRLVVVSNWRSKIKFDYYKHIKVNDNFIQNYQDELKNIFSNLIKIPSGSIVMCSASSLTNILGYKLFKKRRDITFLDVGTAINDLLSLPINTRTYHKFLTEYKNYSYLHKCFKLFINDLLINW